MQYGLAAAGSSLSTEVVQDRNSRTRVFPGLQKGTDYRARVVGSNSVGQGTYSEFEVTQTLVDREFIKCMHSHKACMIVKYMYTPPHFLIAPLAPLNLVVTGPGATALNLSWDAPTDNGGRPIDQYLIEIRETAQVQFEDLATSTDTFYFQRMQSVFELVQSTTYEYVVVLCWSNNLICTLI